MTARLVALTWCSPDGTNRGWFIDSLHPMALEQRRHTLEQTGALCELVEVEIRRSSEEPTLPDATALLEEG